MTVTRGTSNGNVRGSSEARRRRRAYLIATYRADVNALVQRDAGGTVLTVFPTSSPLDYPAVLDDGWTLEVCCRCYRCGDVLVEGTVTVDRIVPGCKGGRYVRNNIRPACSGCNSETGGRLASRPEKGRKK